MKGMRIISEAIRSARFSGVPWAAMHLLVVSTTIMAAASEDTGTIGPATPLWRDQTLAGLRDQPSAELPFSFTCDGRSLRDTVQNWQKTRHVVRLDAARVKSVVALTDPQTGLKMTCDSIWYGASRNDSPACDWVLHFENTGSEGTPIIEDVMALDLVLDEPMVAPASFVLHRTYSCQSGGPRGPQVDFDIAALELNGNEHLEMMPNGGRSSDRYFPFFRIDGGRGSLVLAIGWSGQWKAGFRCRNGKELHVTAGLERTHFRLRPGEGVRSPRILAFFWEGDPVACYSKFRRLIYNHYVPAYQGKKPLPFLYSNTCFLNYWPSVLKRIEAEYPQRGGKARHEWMSDRSETTEISIIKALAPLGVEAVVTDAGWFEGGWPAGAGGNWMPEKRTFPNVMGPVAGAAQESGMVYGLWFEPEKVSAHADIAKDIPELVLRIEGNRHQGLLNMGMPAAREYFLGILDRYMTLPGFRVYRQDFNFSPLPYWRQNDAPDRQGMTEMKYIEGLYTLWDEIISRYPDSFMIECAAGGKRIDLETVTHFHTHQKSDLWLSKPFNVAANYSLSRFLPNVCFNTPTKDLDDYTFHLSLPSSMCVGGWGANESDFPTRRAQKLASRYFAVRDLLVGDWYPLTDYGAQGWNKDTSCLVSQYHRPELGKGLVLAYRRGRDKPRTVTIHLHGLDPASRYQLEFDATGEQRVMSGAALRQGLDITLNVAPASEMVVYSRGQ